MKKMICLPVSFKMDLKRQRLERMISNATGHLIDLWLTVADQRPDGILTSWDEMDIASAANWPMGEQVATFVTALMDAGLIDQGKNGYYLPDWTTQQPGAADSTKRKTKASINALIRHHGREKGLKIAVTERKIDVTKHGYEVPHGCRSIIESMKNDQKITDDSATSRSPAENQQTDSMQAAAQNKKYLRKGALVNRIAGK